jgi:hypothetical protein
LAETVFARSNYKGKGLVCEINVNRKIFDGRLMTPEEDVSKLRIEI